MSKKEDWINEVEEGWVESYQIVDKKDVSPSHGTKIIKIEDLRFVLHNLEWIKILNNAIGSRPTSWNFSEYNHPVIEWRNASDEICMALIKELEDVGIIGNKALTK